VFEVVERVLTIQQILAEKKSVTLVSRVDPSVYVTADNNMLELIIRNLVNNAIKFTPGGGQVLIMLKVDNGICQLMVIDNGIGIDTTHKEDIFSLKSHSTFGTNNEKGIGLGLVLCKELQALQAGDLWFDSVPGKGTTFYATLPIADPAADGRLSA
jgi:signal transduction histidine kinase